MRTLLLSLSSVVLAVLVGTVRADDKSDATAMKDQCAYVKNQAWVLKNACGSSLSAADAKYNEAVDAYNFHYQYLVANELYETINECETYLTSSCNALGLGYVLDADAAACYAGGVRWETGQGPNAPYTDWADKAYSEYRWIAAYDNYVLARDDYGYARQWWSDGDDSADAAKVDAEHVISILP